MYFLVEETGFSRKCRLKYVFFPVRMTKRFLSAGAVKSKKFAIPAFPSKTQHFPALGCRLSPAGFIPVVIGRAEGINIFRAPQKIPARLASVAETCHCFHPEVDPHGFENRDSGFTFPQRGMRVCRPKATRPLKISNPITRLI